MKRTLTLIAALLLAPLFALRAADGPLALAQACDPGEGESKKATAAEVVVFQPEYAPGPADNPLKGFVPYAGQGRGFRIRWSLAICRWPR